MDSLGFLAYEMVRTLCEAGTANKKRVALARANVAVTLLQQEKDKEDAAAADNGSAEKEDEASSPGTNPRKRRNTNEKDSAKKTGMSPGPSGEASNPPPKRGRKSTLSSEATVSTPRSPPARPLTIPTSLFSGASAVSSVVSTVGTPKGDPGSTQAGAAITDEVFGEREKSTLRLEDVNAGFVAMQHDQASSKAFGMRKWRGGVSRIATRLV